MIGRVFAGWLMVVVAGFGGAVLAAPPSVPAVSAFNGTWVIARVVGASNGGVTADDPKAMLGKIVHWGAKDVVSPDGDCRLRDPAVELMDNALLEDGIWGGQRILELDLSKTEIALGFGAKQTAVFQDDSGCANGVLIGGAHLIEALGSGWIYRLDRVGG